MASGQPKPDIPNESARWPLYVVLIVVAVAWRGAGSLFCKC